MTIETNITKMFGIKYPIFSAPMGPFYTQALAAATSEAGGLGVLSEIGLIGVDPFPEMKKHMEFVVEHTDKPFGFNVRTARAEYKRSEYICNEIPKFIQENSKLKEQCIYAVTSAGSSKLMPQAKGFQQLKESGSQIKHFHVAPAFWLAEKCIKYGVDGLCVTGMEGGGHQSYEQTGGMTLLAQVQQVFPDIPKIAAGGYGTGAGLAAAMTLGAGAIVLGTRLIASKECEFPQVYKDLIPKADSRDSVLVQGVISNVRVFDNAYAKLHHLLSKAEKLKYESSITVEQQIEDARMYDKVYDGDVENTCVPMGQSAGLVHDIKSVSEIIDVIMRECEERLKQAVSCIK